MKKFLIFIGIAFCLLTCTPRRPSLTKVEEGTINAARELLEEDNNENVYRRMDRYFIDDQPSILVYTGSLKSTVFYKSFYSGLDSIKIYYDVTVKFYDKNYDAFSISLEPRK